MNKVFIFQACFPKWQDSNPCPNKLSSLLLTNKTPVLLKQNQSDFYLFLAFEMSKSTYKLLDSRFYHLQGLWMGYLTAAGSSARVAGPVVVSYVYEKFGTYPTMAIMIGSLLISLALTILTYKRMAQFPVAAVAPATVAPAAVAAAQKTESVESTNF